MIKKKTAVLLINLGTPSAPTLKSVRHFLREFLSDPRVIDVPKVLRWSLINLLVLPFRAKKSTQAYQKIWLDEGSPLLINSIALARSLQKHVQKNITVALAMRYGQPHIKQVITQLLQQKPDHLIIVPLFPQYASAASGSAISACFQHLQSQRSIPDVTIVSEFYNHPKYIGTYSSFIKNNLEKYSIDHLVFSFHGLPQRQIFNEDCFLRDCQHKGACPVQQCNHSNCYRAQCSITAHRIAEQLNLNASQYSISFQSRLGRTPWIHPYTDFLLDSLAKQGTKNIAMVCPSFICDCLETLEEINIRAKKQWQQSGGEGFIFVPSLNAHPQWAHALKQIIEDHAGHKL